MLVFIKYQGLSGGHLIFMFHSAAVAAMMCKMNQGCNHIEDVLQHYQKPKLQRIVIQVLVLPQTPSVVNYDFILVILLYFS